MATGTPPAGADGPSAEAEPAPAKAQAPPAKAEPPPSEATTETSPAEATATVPSGPVEAYAQASADAWPTGQPVRAQASASRANTLGAGARRVTWSPCTRRSWDARGGRNPDCGGIGPKEG